MAVNKVEVNGSTLIDLTNDTVTPSTLLKGATAHNAAGEQINGNADVYTKSETDALLANKQNTLTFDTAPTLNSNNPVTSGGIATYVNSNKPRIWGIYASQSNLPTSANGVRVYDAAFVAVPDPNQSGQVIQHDLYVYYDTWRKQNGTLSNLVLSVAQWAALNSGITAEMIPNQASADNQLADKAFVNSSIANATADFRGTYDSIADLNAYSGDKNNNDYAFVKVYDPVEPTQVLQYDKYKYNGSAWVFEFTLNNSSFTAVMWAAINSGITEALVNSIPGKYVKPSGGIPSTDMSADVQASLAKADSAAQTSSSQLTSTFTIGTVNWCRKVGKVVEFCIYLEVNNATNGTIIAQLPAGYHPPERCYPSCYGISIKNFIMVRTDGSITWGGDSVQTTTILRMHGTFIAA